VRRESLSALGRDLVAAEQALGLVLVERQTSLHPFCFGGMISKTRERPRDDIGLQERD
jgi:hypothetical protein